MAVLEAIVGRIFAFVLDLFESVLRRRPAIRVRPGVREESAGFMGTIDGGVGAWSRDAALWVHNSGQTQFTVNEAGWEAGDGTRLAGDFGDATRTLAPGGPELLVTKSATEVVALHDQHSGVTHLFVVLAGADEPYRKRVPETWIGKVREVASRPTVTSW
jgi:hypothetical protein